MTSPIASSPTPTPPPTQNRRPTTTLRPAAQPGVVLPTRTSSQTVVFTALPQGVSAPGSAVARLSVFISPQLTFVANTPASKPTLVGFPDWVNWPNTLRQAGSNPFTVAVNGQPVTSAVPDLTVLRPDIWAAIFDPVKTRVDYFVADDFSQTTPTSYRALAVHDFLLNTVYGPMTSAMNTDPSQATLTINGTTTSGPGKGQVKVVGQPTAAGTAFGYLQNPPDEFADVLAFHTTPRIPLVDGAPPALVPPVYDFHQTLSALHGYPELLPMLGLVVTFDLTLPDSIASSPDSIMVTVKPNWTPVGPKGTYVVLPTLTDPSTFLPQAAGPDYAGGLLEFNRGPGNSPIAVVDYDIDAACENLDAYRKKVTSAAIAKAPSGPATLQLTLPSLRSVGPTLIWDTWGDEASDLASPPTMNLAYLAKRQAAIAKNILAYVADPSIALQPLYQEDITRGWRWDVLRDDVSGLHPQSLHWQVGSYRFGVDQDIEYTSPRPVEGFVSPSATTGPAPAGSAASGSNDPAFLVHEAIARWDGWGLAAPTPFSVIGSDGTIAESGGNPVTTYSDNGHMNGQISATFTRATGQSARARQRPAAGLHRAAAAALRADVRVQGAGRRPQRLVDLPARSDPGRLPRLAVRPASAMGADPASTGRADVLAHCRRGSLDRRAPRRRHQSADRQLPVAVPAQGARVAGRAAGRPRHLRRPARPDPYAAVVGLRRREHRDTARPRLGHRSDRQCRQCDPAAPDGRRPAGDGRHLATRLRRPRVGHRRAGPAVSRHPDSSTGRRADDGQHLPHLRHDLAIPRTVVTCPRRRLAGDAGQVADGGSRGVQPGGPPISLIPRCKCAGSHLVDPPGNPDDGRDPDHGRHAGIGLRAGLEQHPALHGREGIRPHLLDAWRCGRRFHRSRVRDRRAESDHSGHHHSGSSTRFCVRLSPLPSPPSSPSHAGPTTPSWNSPTRTTGWTRRPPSAVTFTASWTDHSDTTTNAHPDTDLTVHTQGSLVAEVTQAYRDTVGRTRYFPYLPAAVSDPTVAVAEPAGTSPFGQITTVPDRPDQTDPVYPSLSALHRIGDTKHHLVTYSAMATSRFGKYFGRTSTVTLGVTKLRAGHGQGVGEPVPTILNAGGFDPGLLTVTLPAALDTPPYPVPRSLFTLDGANGTIALSSADASVQRPTSLPTTSGRTAGIETVRLSGTPLQVTWVPTDTRADPNNDRQEHILNTATPPPLKVVKVAAAWRSATTGSPTTPTGLRYTRSGNILRIYLERPWYVSGNDELVGVIANPPATDSVPAAGDATIIGFDPISVSSHLARPPYPQGQLAFTGAVATASTGVGDLKVWGYQPEYDPATNLWYADIELDLTEPPPPGFFVRLWLVRYQPYSIEGSALSSPTLVTFAQPVPDRSVTVVRNRNALTVTVSGPGYYGWRSVPASTGFPGTAPTLQDDGNPDAAHPNSDGRGSRETSTMIVEVQKYDTAGGRSGDFAWTTVPASTTRLTPTFSEDSAGGGNPIVDWTGHTIDLPTGAGPYRLRISELDYYPYSSAGLPKAVDTTLRRPFVAHLPLGDQNTGPAVDFNGK